MKVQNKYYCRRDVCYLKINHPPTKTVITTKFDKADLSLVKQYKWCIHTTGKYKRPTPYNFNVKRLHQYLLGKAPGLEVDHINRDYLDNRRSNLRHVTHEQNMWNVAGSNIYFAKDRGKWRVEVSENNRKRSLGAYTLKRDAMAVRKQWETQHRVFPAR